MFDDQDSIIEAMEKAPFKDKPDTVKLHDINDGFWLTRMDSLIFGIVIGLSIGVLTFQFFIKLGTLAGQ